MTNKKKSKRAGAIRRKSEWKGDENSLEIAVVRVVGRAGCCYTPLLLCLVLHKDCTQFYTAVPVPRLKKTHSQAMGMKRIKLQIIIGSALAGSHHSLLLLDTAHDDSDAI